MSLHESFASFTFVPELKKCLEKIGFTTPTPIQSETIPLLLSGENAIGKAQTGSGKTLAYLIPFLHKIQSERKRALVLVPTRELAQQVGDVMQQLKTNGFFQDWAVVIGGGNFGIQRKILKKYPPVVIATPGRLIDHVQQGMPLNDFSLLVIDEADRMLDMGFYPQLKRILAALPEERQTALFSATFPKNLQTLTKEFVNDAIEVAVGTEDRPASTITQEIRQTTSGEKGDLLIDELNRCDSSVIVFVRTKHKTDRLAKFLDDAGVEAVRLHGDRSPVQRRQAIEKFKREEVKVMIATDIAARGLDISHIGLVINFDLPMTAEDYVHRIGRTGRAGASGLAVSFLTPEDRRHWQDLTRFLKKHDRDAKLPVLGSASSRPLKSHKPSKAKAPVKVLAESEDLDLVQSSSTDSAPAKAAAPAAKKKAKLEIISLTDEVAAPAIAMDAPLAIEAAPAIAYAPSMETKAVDAIEISAVVDSTVDAETTEMKTEEAAYTAPASFFDEQKTDPRFRANERTKKPAATFNDNEAADEEVSAKPRFKSERPARGAGTERKDGFAKPRFGNRYDKPLFSKERDEERRPRRDDGERSYGRRDGERSGGSERRSFDKPRFGGGDRFGDRKPRFGADRFGGGDRFSDDRKPRFGSDRGERKPDFIREDRPRRDDGERGGFDKPRFGGGDRFADRKPRFGADRFGGGDRKPRFGGGDRFSDDRKPRFDSERKPRFGADRGERKPDFIREDRPRRDDGERGGFDKPRFGGGDRFADRKPRFGADRFGGGDRKPRFGSDRGERKPDFIREDRKVEAKPRDAHDFTQGDYWENSSKPRFDSKPRFGAERGGFQRRDPRQAGGGDSRFGEEKKFSPRPKTHFSETKKNRPNILSLT